LRAAVPGLTRPSPLSQCRWCGAASLRLPSPSVLRHSFGFDRVPAAALFRLTVVADLSHAIGAVVLYVMDGCSTQNSKDDHIRENNPDRGDEIYPIDANAAAGGFASRPVIDFRFDLKSAPWAPDALRKAAHFDADAGLGHHHLLIHHLRILRIPRGRVFFHSVFFHCRRNEYAASISSMWKSELKKQKNFNLRLYDMILWLRFTLCLRLEILLRRWISFYVDCFL